jgi:hypothetical protein
MCICIWYLCTFTHAHVYLYVNELQAQLMEAQLWMEDGDYEQAVAATGRLLKASPGHLDALVLRGSAYYYTAGVCVEERVCIGGWVRGANITCTFSVMLAPNPQWNGVKQPSLDRVIQSNHSS